MGKAEEPTGGLCEPLVKIGAILGVIQGFIWTVLSLTAILLGQFSLQNTSISPGSLIHAIYLNSSSSDTGLIIDGDSFRYFLYIYVVLSGCWLIVSSLLLWDHFREKTVSKYYEGVLATWMFVVGLTALLDVILFSLLVHDYEKERKNIEVDSPELQLELVAIGVVFTLAARGYVLWIVNVIFAVIAGRVWHLKRNKVVARNQPYISAYSNGQAAPWHQQPQNTYEGFDNKGYRNDSDTLPLPSRRMDNSPQERDRGYARNDDLKQEYRNKDVYWNNRNNQNGREDHTPPRSFNTVPPPPSAYRQEPKTAKIGRQGGQRSPPLNVAPPFIPDPDYSPPGSPKVRGVLRPKSNYEMY
uniref:MARVEL domain-containing protein n=1 Tax=Dendroctonus ponderosae TaxID=77166 RepID=A0AAR5PP92_DENPD